MGVLSEVAVFVELVQSLGQALGGAAVVDEDDGRGVLPDQFEQLGVDRRPDRADLLLLVLDCPGVAHVLDRYDDFEVQLLALAAVDDRAFPLRPDQEPADPVERTLGGRKPDPLHIATIWWQDSPRGGPG